MKGFLTRINYLGVGILARGKGDGTSPPVEFTIMTDDGFSITDDDGNGIREDGE